LFSLLILRQWRRRTERPDRSTPHLCDPFGHRRTVASTAPRPSKHLQSDQRHCITDRAIPACYAGEPHDRSVEVCGC